MSRALPVVVHTRGDLRTVRERLPGPVAVVMTMGALHEGHLELVRRARELGESVLVTIFVNPLQFGEAADLERYPRTLDADLALLAGHADLVFAPPAAEMYPDGEPGVRLSAGPLGEVLEGAHRPGHFDGMLTVVAKLLHLTGPDVALFGQKDAQQLVLIRQMVRDLNFGSEIVAVPTVREPDGLALSSRNVHLSPADRQAALSLSAALRAGQAQSAHGASAIRRAAQQILSSEPGSLVDYLALVHPQTLREIDDHDRGEALLAVAARVGSTRLIDNVPLTVGAHPAPTKEK